MARFASFTAPAGEASETWATKPGNWSRMLRDDLGKAVIDHLAELVDLVGRRAKFSSGGIG